MKKEIDIKVIISKYYEYFYSKLTNYKNFDFNPTESEKKNIDNFIKLISKDYNINSLDENYWFKYFSFQFEYWRLKKTRLGKNNVNFSWVIGPKAYERWSNKQPNYWWFCESGFNKLFGVDKKDLIKPFILNFDNNLIYFHNIERKRFYNQNNGLINCLMATTLYEINNELCEGCIHKIECIKTKNLRK